MTRTTKSRKRCRHFEGFECFHVKHSQELFEKRIPCGAVWMTSEEAAAYLKISLGVLYNLTSQRRLPYHKLGRLNRFLKAELDLHLLRDERGGS